MTLPTGIRRLAVRTPTLPPATHTNAFAVGTGAGVLIEPASPYPDEIDRMVRWVEQCRSEGVALRALLLTHHHPDHAGGAVEMGRRSGLPIWAHAETARRLGPDVQVARRLVDGERIELPGPEPMALRVLHTPGHAPGHLCFFEERTTALVAGDMVAGVGTILVEPDDGDMAAYLDSLERLRGLAPALVLPAHGGLLGPDVLDHYIRHRLLREERVLAALRAHGGVATPAQLVPVAYADAPAAVWPLAERSLLAHLIKLVNEGRAIRRDAGYACPGT